MYSDGIWKVFVNADFCVKTMSLKHICWRYLERFGTVEKNGENNVSQACIMTVFKTIWNYRNHFENNVSKALTVTYLKRVGTEVNILN